MPTGAGELLSPRRAAGVVICGVALAAFVPSSTLVQAEAPSPVDIVRDAQEQRLETIARVSPAVVSIFESTQAGGGSGVLIDPRGFGVTNYHVVANLGMDRNGWGGLPDGNLYELEVLGIDPGGDVAMFRLLGREDFPSVSWGDSDAVRLGDTTLALGNPFSVSEDYAPSVSLGIVTGIDRYQWGVGGNLTYSDCIQTDAAINPGNSGGPLFNAAGEVIGINGRISINTRGRFNVGFGYAISSAQIRRFVPGLRAGLVVPHGTLQARVEDGTDGVAFTQLLPGGPADAAGVRSGDRLLAIDGEPIPTANRFASVMGTYPGNWLIELTIRRNGKDLNTLARLDDLPVKMSQPYEVDATVNRREAVRVLRAFRARVGVERGGGDLSAGRAGGTNSEPLRWTVVREYPSENSGGPSSTERYAATFGADGTAMFEEVVSDGARARKIRFDAEKASWSRADSDRAFEFTSDVRVSLSAIFALLSLYTDDLDSPRFAAIAHAAGDAYFLPANQDRPRNPFEPAESAFTAPRIAEVLAVPIGERCVARLVFDEQTHELRRIDARDELNGIAVTINVVETVTAGNWNLPAVLDVFGPGYAYRERWQEWQVSP